MLVSRGLVACVPALLAGVLLAGCGTSVNRAPVEDRGTATGMAASSSSTVAPAVKPLPGAENAGKPGYYTVKPGDTLIRIGLEHGQTWKDIARWSGVVTRPVASSALAPLPAASAAKPAASSAQAAAPAASAPSHAATGGEDDMPFIWPSSGPLLAGFDEARNKGYDIGGKAGDPVLAAADGRVVYAGAGLRGYGNLIILKHNNTYLTAYAHNQTLLVKEDQNVRRGQKIAEMGSTDADRVKLHFEIRRQGKPVDPQRYLPSR